MTWVLYPPSTSGVLWFAIAVLFFYYPIGTSLERTIGTFKYTLYILSGVIFTILGAFILYFLLGGNVLVGNVFSTYYISLSTFLAYAMCYPDMQVLLMFIIQMCIRDSATSALVGRGLRIMESSIWVAVITGT